jgi:hypothetical protein
MTGSSWTRVVAAIAMAIVLAALGRASPPAPGRPVAEDRGTLTYDASVDPTSASVIEQALASARPEAAGLLARIDGLTTVSIGRPDDGALGVASTRPDGRYDVVLDLGETMRTTGTRGATRLVLHELGHVVDFELVDPALAAQLDDGIPPGLPCPAGTHIGSCAPREERFAETFAKWAMGNDIGADLYIGYAVPPPGNFEAWAAPLVALVA